MIGPLAGIKNKNVLKLDQLILRMLIIGGMSISFGLSTAYAQPSQSSAAQQLQRIQQEQQLRQQKQYEEDLKSSRPPAELSVPIDTPTPSEAGGPCLEVNDIQLLGVSSLKVKEFQPVLDSYLGRCLNVGDIERLMAETTAVYILKGYITARVYLAEQDLKGGVLILRVVEGELEKVDITDAGSDSISLFNVFPGKIGEPLNLRDIEQAVDQLNRLQSNNVTTSISPGDIAGSSILVLDNHRSKPWRVNLSYDNHGAESTGQEQGTTNVGVDNPLGFNDFLSLTHNRTFPYDSNKRGSKLSSLTYVVPFGYSTLAVNASRSDYTSPLNLANGSTLESSGNSENISFRLDRTVFRDRDSRWNLVATVTNKDTENYLGGALLSVSSRTLTVVDIDSAYSFPLLGGVTTLNLGFARGVDWFGALEDPGGLPGFAPQAQFSKWKYGASYSTYLQINDQPISLTSRLIGQYADDVLYGSEALLVGGIYTVRGFSQNSLSGERGFYWRNDISIPFNISPFNGYGVSLRPYLGVDYGRVSNNSKNVPDGSLAGMAIGVSLFVGGVNMDLFSSKAVEKSSGMSDEGYQSYFRISVSI
jgi:hemolysin activation/secretion protein